jgi:CHAD domain-containing protein
MSIALQVFHSNIEVLLSNLPSVRDGDVDAIHDSRVATRRLRAALPLVSGSDGSKQWQPLQRMIRRTGRALGRVRDLDVSVALLEELEFRAPVTAPAAAAMRARLLPKRLARARKLIKRIERMDLAMLRDRHRLPVLRPPSPRMLLGAIGEGAGRARRAIEHASGLYFPKRAHEVRVELKKLRYTVEMLDDADQGRRASLRVFKAAQEALGQLHDREVIARRLKQLARRGEVPAAPPLADVLEAESRRCFGTYLDARDALLAACDGLLEFSHPHRARRLAGGMLTIGALALPSAAVVLFANRGSK